MSDMVWGKHAAGKWVGTGMGGGLLPSGDGWPAPVLAGHWFQCFPVQCQRSRSSICWLHGQGCRAGKVLGTGDNSWDKQDRAIKKQNPHGPWITQGFLVILIFFLTSSLQVASMEIQENLTPAKKQTHSEQRKRPCRTQQGGEHQGSCIARA